MTILLDDNRYAVILTNPPFSAPLRQPLALGLNPKLKTRKSELLFLDLVMRSLEAGGRAAVIVPGGVLFNTTTRAHKALRKALVAECGLDAVIALLPDAFGPYTNVRTAVLVFGDFDAGTDDVWFCDASSPDDVNPTRWLNRRTGIAGRNGPSFVVPRPEIADNDYNLTFKRYQEFVFETPEYDPPEVILDELERLEAEIAKELAALRALLDGVVR